MRRMRPGVTWLWTDRVGLSVVFSLDHERGSCRLIGVSVNVAHAQVLAGVCDLVGGTAAGGERAGLLKPGDVAHEPGFKAFGVVFERS
jgi:hypothetical protein